MSMKEKIQLMIDKFEKKVESNPEFKEEVTKYHKTMNIDLGDENYSLRMDAGKVSDFKEGLLDQADITVITKAEHMEALIEGTLRPMKAYVTKKVVIKGKIDDIMAMKKFF